MSEAQIDQESRDAYLKLIAMDDQRLGMGTEPQPIRESLKVAWCASRNPLMGGEYYRATRPAALANRDFGWHTVVAEKIGTKEGSSKPACQAYGGQHIVEPDVWIFRPIGQQGQHDNWSLTEIVDRCHAAGQKVICDLDDDIWSHEDWTEDERPTGENDDRFEEWCWQADGWLVSTPFLKERVEQIAARRGVPIPKVAVAPNCYDPYGLGANSRPIPGRRLGTRLWMSGRMSGDLEIYKACITPLLERLDLTFVHIGREYNVEEGPGSHARNFIDDCDMPARRVLELTSVTIPELGQLLGATINIGVIAIADHPFNRAKTETHAVELAAAGLPFVAATTLEIYDQVPGKVAPRALPVRQRIEHLLDAENWLSASERGKVWARKTSVRAEAIHMRALQQMVHELIRA